MHADRTNRVALILFGLAYIYATTGNSDLGMIRDVLPPQRRGVIDKTRLAHLLVMALDGYSIHNHINPRGVADNATIDAMAELLLGTVRQPRPRHTKGNGLRAGQRLSEKSLKSL